MIRKKTYSKGSRKTQLGLRVQGLLHQTKSNITRKGHSIGCRCRIQTDTQIGNVVEVKNSSLMFYHYVFLITASETTAKYWNYPMNAPFIAIKVIQNDQWECEWCRSCEGWYWLGGMMVNALRLNEDIDFRLRSAWSRPLLTFKWTIRGLEFRQWLAETCITYDPH